MVSGCLLLPQLSETKNSFSIGESQNCRLARQTTAFFFALSPSASSTAVCCQLSALALPRPPCVWASVSFPFSLSLFLTRALSRSLFSRHTARGAACRRHWSALNWIAAGPDYWCQSVPPHMGPLELLVPSNPSRSLATQPGDRVGETGRERELHLSVIVTTNCEGTAQTYNLPDWSGWRFCSCGTVRGYKPFKRTLNALGGRSSLGFFRISVLNGTALSSLEVDRLPERRIFSLAITTQTLFIHVNVNPKSQELVSIDLSSVVQLSVIHYKIF